MNNTEALNTKEQTNMDNKKYVPYMLSEKKLPGGQNTQHLPLNGKEFTWDNDIIQLFRCRNQQIF